MLIEQNRLKDSRENIERSFSANINQNFSGNSDFYQSIKVDLKGKGQVTIQQILDENKLLKEKVKRLQSQIYQLRRCNLQKNSIFSPFKKPSKKIPLFQESSLIKIENLSSIGSTESPALKRDQRKFSIEKSCSNESLPNSSCIRDQNHLEVFSDSNLLISVGDTESNGTKNKKLQQMPKSSEAFDDDLIQSKTKRVNLKIRKCATLNENDNILRESNIDCDDSKLKINCTQSDSEGNSINLYDVIQKNSQKAGQEPVLKRTPKIQSKRQVEMVVSLPRSDLSEWIDYNLNHQVLSEQEESERDSFMEQSDVISKVLVSNNRISKKSAKGGLLLSSKLTDKSLTRSPQRKKMRETRQCELIHEEQEHMEKEDNEPATKKTNQMNHSVNMRRQKFNANSGRKITEEDSGEEQNQKCEMITKSLAQGSVRQKIDELSSENQIQKKKTIINSQKSTYDNSENTGVLKFSSTTDKLALLQKNDQIKMKKSYVQKTHNRGLLQSIKQSDHKECEEGAGGSIKKSKSSHNLKKVSLPHQSFDKPKYDMVVSKLANKIKAVSEKNLQLRGIIHRLRHDFYDIHNNDSKFKKKATDESTGNQYQIDKIQICKVSGECDCSFEKCPMKKIPHYIRTKHRLSDSNHESKC